MHQSNYLLNCHEVSFPQDISELKVESRFYQQLVYNKISFYSSTFIPHVYFSKCIRLRVSCDSPYLVVCKGELNEASYESGNSLPALCRGGGGGGSGNERNHHWVINHTRTKSRLLMQIKPNFSEKRSYNDKCAF